MLNIEFFEKTNIKTDGIDLDKSYISFDSSTLNGGFSNSSCTFN